jgi:hypothetical protein
MYRTREDERTYWHVVARCLDYDGTALCFNCGKPADDVHEILPRSFFGSNKQEEAFAMSNRCCLCRRCHEALHNDRGRAILLNKMQERYGYEYEGLAKCLLDDYRAAGLLLPMIPKGSL